MTKISGAQYQKAGTAFAISLAVKWKIWVFIILVSFIGFLMGACSSSDDSPQSSQKSSSPQLFGSGDGAGGGNTCDGKPIESYAMGLPDVGPRVEEHPAFIKHIKPILDSFETYVDEEGEIKHNYIYLFLTYAIKNKNWHLIPYPIDPLAAQQIGAVVSTDQGASQTMDAVWFSTPALKGKEKTDDLDFARLITHEMLQATRLLKFESAYTQCLIQAPPSWCGKKDLSRSGQASDLSQKDYDHIRTATNEFLSFSKDTTHQQWTDFMARHFQVLSNVRFTSTDDLVKIKPEKIQKAIDSTQITKAMPSLGYHEPWFGSGEQPHPCQTTFEWIEEEKRYKGRVKEENGKEFLFYFSLPEEKEQFAWPNERTQLLEITLWNDERGKGIKKGELVTMVDINFYAHLDGLTSIFIKKIICHEHESRDGIDYCTHYSGSHEETYLCTNQSFDLGEEEFVGM